MKCFIYRTYLLLVILCFCSCNKPSDNITTALQASGKNKPELEKVLDHYKNDKDTQKYKAACFLIENMVDKFTLDAMSVDYNQRYYDALTEYRIKNKTYGASGLYDVCDSINKITEEKGGFSPRYNRDIRTIKADFLIRHIDEMFEVWNKSPWKTKVGFDDFCRFILPYKVYESYWEGTVRYFRNIYSGVDTIYKDCDYIDAGKYLCDDVNRNFTQDGQFFEKYPFMQPTTFKNVLDARVGQCFDYNTTAVSALRSMGIPATINTIPYWGNSNASHYWTEIIGKPVKALYYNTQMAFTSIDDELINDSFWFKGDVISDTTGIPHEVNVRSNRTVPKIYRINYEINRTSLACKTTEDIPKFFKNRSIEDVTNHYVVCKDIEISVPKDIKSEQYMYLCCYNPDNISWTAVAWAEVKRGKATFKNVGINVLYMPAFYKDKNYIPLGEPVIITKDGTCRHLKADTSTKQKAILFSKVPLRTNVLYYATRMQGGKIMIANKVDLSDTTAIYNIDEVPYYTQDVKVENRKASRYVIYQNLKVPLQFVAELEFWGKDKNGKDVKFTGKEIGNTGFSIGPRHSAFDGDRVSYCYFDVSQKEQYIGLDFGKPQTITRIKYCPRSDDNAIVPGEDYELYYWADGWQSLGRQKGGDDYRLVYDNIPANALLRLHNHTRGKENRPFTIEEGRQVWW